MGKWEMVLLTTAVYTLLTFHSRKVRTRDMGGNNTTHEFVRTILDKMEAGL